MRIEIAHLTAAYGRVYKSKAEVLRDLRADKDFRIHVGGQSTYINRPQFKDAGITELVVRYGTSNQYVVRLFVDGEEVRE